MTVSDVEGIISADSVVFLSISYPTEFTNNSFTHEPDPIENYKDIDPNGWYVKYLDSVCSCEIMIGTGEGTFEPNAALKRAMLVTILFRADDNIVYRIYTELNSEAKPLDFSDVSSDTWYSEAIAWASELGIINGYPDGTFCPNKPISREEAVTVFARYYKLNAEYLPIENTDSTRYIPHADDSLISDWARDSFNLCVTFGAVYVKLAEFDESGNLVDTSSYIFEPTRTITRAEGAKLLYEMLLPLRDAKEGRAELPKSLYIPYYK